MAEVNQNQVKTSTEQPLSEQLAEISPDNEE
jgi:hypothetical protein